MQEIDIAFPFVFASFIHVIRRFVVCFPVKSFNLLGLNMFSVRS